MPQFNGDKKVGTSLFTPIEKELVNYFVPKIPSWLETYHLTLLTIPWCIGILIFSFLAGKTDNMHWLWLVSVMIFLQYITDLFDGAVGRHRKTGLIKWGYYMDHLLDYVFLCSILIGYGFIIEDSMKYMLFFVLAVFGGFMVNSYLSFAATNEFKIFYLFIGPTEIRLLFIIINALIAIFGKTHMRSALPYVLFISFICLIYVVYEAQKKIWDLDMEEKKRDAASLERQPPHPR